MLHPAAAGALRPARRLSPTRPATHLGPRRHGQMTEVRPAGRRLKSVHPAALIGLVRQLIGVGVLDDLLRIDEARPRHRPERAVLRWLRHAAGELGADSRLVPPVQHRPGPRSLVLVRVVERAPENLQQVLPGRKRQLRHIPCVQLDDRHQRHRFPGVAVRAIGSNSGRWSARSTGCARVVCVPNRCSSPGRAT